MELQLFKVNLDDVSSFLDLMPSWRLCCFAWRHASLTVTMSSILCGIFTWSGSSGGSCMAGPIVEGGGMVGSIDCGSLLGADAGCNI